MKRVLRHYNTQLEKTLPEIYNSLFKMGIEPEFYAYRWILLLFSQEFNMADIIFLWDTLLCFFNYGEEESLIEYLEYLCFGFLWELKDSITQENVSTTYSI
jgi:hypothetical protein